MSVSPQSSPPFRGLPASFLAACILVSALPAQTTVRVAQRTAFLREPGGVRLATLPAGTRIAPGRSRGDWVETVLDGWIWSRSVSPTTRDGYDLIVASGEGENVRAEPDGMVLARAEEGALFRRVGTRGGWTRVRRSGWITRSSLPRAVTAASGLGAGTGGTTSARRDTAVPVNAPPAEASAPPAQAPARDTSREAGRADPEERRVLVGRGTPVYRAPEGQAIARLDAPLDGIIAATDRDWVRVRFEAWVRASELAGSPPPRPAITAADIRGDPARFIGRTVTWRLQFLAHQRADELRPEMPLGQSYLLTRGPLPESGFVYVMVTREQARELVGLEPLDDLEATVVIRAGRTRYLATPVVELVRLATP